MNFKNKHLVMCIMVFCAVLFSMIFHACYWSNKYDEISTYESSLYENDSTGFCMNDWFPYTSKDTLTVTELNGKHRFFVSELKRTPSESYVHFKPIASDLTSFNDNFIKIWVYDKSDEIKIKVKINWNDRDKQHSNDYYYYAGNPIELEKFIVMNLDSLKQKYHENYNCYDLVYVKHQGLTQAYLYNPDIKGHDEHQHSIHYVKKIDIKK